LEDKGCQRQRLAGIDLGIGKQVEAEEVEEGQVCKDEQINVVEDFFLVWSEKCNKKYEQDAEDLLNRELLQPGISQDVTYIDGQSEEKVNDSKETHI